MSLGAWTDRRSFCLGIGQSAAAISALGGCMTLRRAAAVRPTQGPLLFAYFSTGKGEADGLKLALSEDGFTFKTLRGGTPVLVPRVGVHKLLRDPFLFRGQGPDAPFHCLWTTDWDGVTIGHATSHDLITWSAQQAIPVMATISGTRNCWAPEAIFDPRSGMTVIFWSSTVSGRFTETAGTSESGYNHRLWYTVTRDFARFAPPQVLYDPGFSVIDGTFAHAPDGGLWLVVKDETVTPPRKWLRAAPARSALGPFGALGAPFTPAWVEGAMTARIGEELICYYDVYRDGRWGAASTRDMAHWHDVSDQLIMPQGARHGSVLRISGDLASTL